jgi:CBS domain-containing protein
MQVKDVMTRNVISVQSDDQVLKAARLMLQNRISGLPVVDKNGELVGIVTEGDFLRRSELGTQRRRSKWLEFIVGPGKLAEDYVHASGRKVEEIMTPEPCVVSEDDTLEKVVELMERRRVKRLPVVRAGRMVGIVSRNQVLTALGAQHWAPRVNVVVKNGVAEVWGTITDDRERQGIIVVVENVDGVKEVHDHLVWVEPMSAMAFPSPEDEAKERAAAH